MYKEKSVSVSVNLISAYDFMKILTYLPCPWILSIFSLDFSSQTDGNSRKEQLTYEPIPQYSLPYLAETPAYVSQTSDVQTRNFRPARPVSYWSTYQLINLKAKEKNDTHRLFTFLSSSTLDEPFITPTAPSSGIICGCRYGAGASLGCAGVVIRHCLAASVRWWSCHCPGLCSFWILGYLGIW